MTLIDQARPLQPQRSVPQTLPGPNYEAEADRGRLKVRGNQQLRSSSQPIPPRTLAEEILATFRADVLHGETTFALESHGGYARTVTGTIAYLDEEAQTFLVLAPDGSMERVPLRDIASVPIAAVSDRGQEPPLGGMGSDPAATGARGPTTAQGARLP
jgi:hypothetical protein